jgi:H-type small acid-soluble spore protein
MQAQRAQEILASEDVIPVVHDGVSVWIDSVNVHDATAKVHNENNKGNTKTVPVQELKELH